MTTLAALLALACCVQAWTISHAVVPAQDAVRYVLMAQSYQRDGLLPGLRAETEHPLFPMLIWLVHSARQLVGDSPSWALSAQFAAAGMLVLSVVPVCLLLRRLVDASAAAAGSIFYCLMTSVARLGADALTDSTQLLLVSGMLYALARWWRTEAAEFQISNLRSQISNRESEISNVKLQISNKFETPNSNVQNGSALWLLMTGLLMGMALLARPEAAVLAPSLALTVLWLQCSAGRRQPWSRLALAAGALALGIGLIQVPYAIATASFTQQSLTARLLGRKQIGPETSATPSGKAWQTPDGQRMEFGLKDRSVSSRFHGYTSATKEYFRELPAAFDYWIGALGLAGVWMYRRNAKRPFDRFAVVLFVTHSLAAIHFAANLGYLSDRHLLPLAPLALAPAGYAACYAGSRLLNRTERVNRVIGCATVALAAIACLPRTLAPLHLSHLGHRQAGEWLAANAQPPGTVLDTRGWTAFYSGRTTLRYDAAKTAYRLPNLAFVVIEQRELERNSPRAHTLLHLLNGAAEQAAVFLAPGSRTQDNVLVYRWHPERLTDDLLTARLSIEYGMQDTGSRMQDAGCRISEMTSKCSILHPESCISNPDDTDP